jgi:signal transduction histidine kinase
MRSQHATAEPMIRPDSAVPDLSGRRLALVRGAWAVLVSLNLVLFVVAVPALFVQRSAPRVPVRAGLRQIGLSEGLYAAYFTVLLVAFGLVCFVVAAVIAWRRSTEFMGLLASLYLVLAGAVNAPNVQALEAVHPAWGLPVKFAQGTFLVSLLLFPFLFPDGRFVPRWTRFLAGLLSLGAVVALFFGGGSATDPPDSLGMLLITGLLAGAAAQIYRYLRVSDPAQRQQTKWVVTGITASITAQVAGILAPLSLSHPGVPALLYNVADVTVVTLAAFLVPLTIGIAILRYRLWDIDVIINRALVYGALTAIIGGTYVLVVGGLGTLLQARGNLLVSLLAAGVVAVLFAPLRDKLQRGVNRLMYGERDDPYAVISRLGERLESSPAPDTVLPTIVESVMEALRLPYAAITLKGIDVPVASTGEPVGKPLRLPLVYRNETVGELLLGPRGPSETFSPADRRLLEVLARQAGVAAHAVRLTSDLQRSRQRLVAAREEERRRLRRDLHDGLGAQLAGLNVQTGVLRRLIPEDPGAADEVAVELRTELQSAIADIRRLVYDLRPPALDDLGLISALRQLADRYGAEDERLRVAVEAPQDLPHLPAAAEVAAYRISQEALTNVVRHAHAQSCVVRLAVADEMVLEIIDDGIGVPEVRTAGVGLFSMRERAAELGGTCVVEGAPEGGTRVLVRLPLPEGS